MTDGKLAFNRARGQAEGREWPMCGGRERVISVASPSGISINLVMFQYRQIGHSQYLKPGVLQPKVIFHMAASSPATFGWVALTPYHKRLPDNDLQNKCHPARLATQFKLIRDP